MTEENAKGSVNLPCDLGGKRPTQSGPQYVGKRKLISWLPWAFPALPLFWFLTAPAADAVQRIVSGTEPRLLAVLIRDAADAYQTPLAQVVKVPVLRRVADSVGDFWWRVLDPPDTTP